VLDVTSAPVWLFAIALAVVAPLAVGWLHAALGLRVRRRTLDVLQRAGVPLPRADARRMRPPPAHGHGTARAGEESG
jgi:hypothetical protein